MEPGENVIRQFISATQETEVYEAAVSGVTQHPDVDDAAVAIVDEDTLVVGPETGSQYDSNQTFSLDDTPFAQVLDSGEALILDDLTQHQSPNTPDRSLVDLFTDSESLIIAPIRPDGIIVAAGTPKGCFDADDRAFMVTTANFAAAAIERIRQTIDTAIESEEYASILSHDLRNPLLVAEGYLQLARDSHDAEHFDRVESALERMDELIEQIATLARTGQRIDNPTPIDFERSVRAAWEHVVTGPTTLEVNLTEAQILADETGLKQLLENVFANAAEHGGPEVTVRVGLTNNGFFVEDTGAGIPPEEREQVFDRGYSSSDDRPGIGLSIVHRLAEAHGWSVRAAESPEGGARFVFTGVEFKTPDDT